MKTKQEKIIRSVYMPKAYWDSIDECAEKDDLSSNQVIRKIVDGWIKRRRKAAAKTEDGAGLRLTTAQV